MAFVDALERRASSCRLRGGCVICWILYCRSQQSSSLSSRRTSVGSQAHVEDAALSWVSTVWADDHPPGGGGQEAPSERQTETGRERQGETEGEGGETATRRAVSTGFTKQAGRALSLGAPGPTRVLKLRWPLAFAALCAGGLQFLSDGVRAGLSPDGQRTWWRHHWEAQPQPFEAPALGETLAVLP